MESKLIELSSEIRHDLFLIRRKFIRLVTTKQREAKRESIQNEIWDIKEVLKGTRISDEDRNSLIREMARLKCQKRML